MSPNDEKRMVEELGRNGLGELLPLQVNNDNVTNINPANSESDSDKLNRYVHEDTFGNYNDNDELLATPIVPKAVETSTSPDEPTNLEAYAKEILPKNF